MAAVAAGCGRSRNYISLQLRGERPLLRETTDEVLRLTSQRMSEVRQIRSACTRALELAKDADPEIKAALLAEADTLNRVASEMVSPVSKAIEIKTATGYVITDPDGRLIFEVGAQAVSRDPDGGVEMQIELPPEVIAAGEVPEGEPPGRSPEEVAARIAKRKLEWGPGGTKRQQAEE